MNSRALRSSAFALPVLLVLPLASLAGNPAAHYMEGGGWGEGGPAQPALDYAAAMAIIRTQAEAAKTKGYLTNSADLRRALAALEAGSQTAFPGKELETARKELGRVALVAATTESKLANDRGDSVIRYLADQLALLVSQDQYIQKEVERIAAEKKKAEEEQRRQQEGKPPPPPPPNQPPKPGEEPPGPSPASGWLDRPEGKAAVAEAEKFDPFNPKTDYNERLEKARKKIGAGQFEGGEKNLEDIPGGDAGAGPRLSGSQVEKLFLSTREFRRTKLALDLAGLSGLEFDGGQFKAGGRPVPTEQVEKFFNEFLPQVPLNAEDPEFAKLLSLSDYQELLKAYGSGRFPDAFKDIKLEDATLDWAKTCDRVDPSKCNAFAIARQTFYQAGKPVSPQILADILAGLRRGGLRDGIVRSIATTKGLSQAVAQGVVEGMEARALAAFLGAELKEDQDPLRVLGRLLDAEFAKELGVVEAHHWDPEGWARLVLEQNPRVRQSLKGMRGGGELSPPEEKRLERALGIFHGKEFDRYLSRLQEAVDGKKELSGEELERLFDGAHKAAANISPDALAAFNELISQVRGRQSASGNSGGPVERPKPLGGGMPVDGDDYFAQLLERSEMLAKLYDSTLFARDALKLPLSAKEYEHVTAIYEARRVELKRRWVDAELPGLLVELSAGAPADPALARIRRLHADSKKDPSKLDLAVSELEHYLGAHRADPKNPIAQANKDMRILAEQSERLRAALSKKEHKESSGKIDDFQRKLELLSKSLVDAVKAFAEGRPDDAAPGLAQAREVYSGPDGLGQEAWPDRIDHLVARLGQAAGQTNELGARVQEGLWESLKGSNDPKLEPLKARLKEKTLEPEAALALLEALAQKEKDQAAAAALAADAAALKTLLSREKELRGELAAFLDSVSQGAGAWLKAKGVPAELADLVDSIGRAKESLDKVRKGRPHYFRFEAARREHAELLKQFGERKGWYIPVEDLLMEGLAENHQMPPGTKAGLRDFGDSEFRRVFYNIDKDRAGQEGIELRGPTADDGVFLSKDGSRTAVMHGREFVEYRFEKGEDDVIRYAKERRSISADRSELSETLKKAFAKNQDSSWRGGNNTPQSAEWGMLTAEGIFQPERSEDLLGSGHKISRKYHQGAWYQAMVPDIDPGTFEKIGEHLELNPEFDYASLPAGVSLPGIGDPRRIAEVQRLAALALMVRKDPKEVSRPGASRHRMFVKDGAVVLQTWSELSEAEFRSLEADESKLDAKGLEEREGVLSKQITMRFYLPEKEGADIVMQWYQPKFKEHAGRPTFVHRFTPDGRDGYTEKVMTLSQKGDRWFYATREIELRAGSPGGPLSQGTVIRERDPEEIKEFSTWNGFTDLPLVKGSAKVLGYLAKPITAFGKIAIYGTASGITLAFAIDAQELGAEDWAAFIAVRASIEGQCSVKLADESEWTEAEYRIMIETALKEVKDPGVRERVKKALALEAFEAKFRETPGQDRETFERDFKEQHKTWDEQFRALYPQIARKQRAADFIKELKEQGGVAGLAGYGIDGAAFLGEMAAGGMALKPVGMLGTWLGEGLQATKGGAKAVAILNTELWVPKWAQKTGEWLAKVESKLPGVKPAAEFAEKLTPEQVAGQTVTKVLTAPTHIAMQSSFGLDLIHQAGSMWEAPDWEKSYDLAKTLGGMVVFSYVSKVSETQRTQAKKPPPERVPEKVPPRERSPDIGSTGQSFERWLSESASKIPGFGFLREAYGSNERVVRDAMRRGGVEPGKVGGYLTTSKLPLQGSEGDCFLRSVYSHPKMDRIARLLTYEEFVDFSQKVMALDNRTFQGKTIDILKDGVEHGDKVALLRSLGYYFDRVNAETPDQLRRIISKEGPLLSSVDAGKDRHAVDIYGFDGEKFITYDPNMPKLQELDFKQFQGLQATRLEAREEAIADKYLELILKAKDIKIKTEEGWRKPSLAELREMLKPEGEPRRQQRWVDPVEAYAEKRERAPGDAFGKYLDKLFGGEREGEAPGAGEFALDRELKTRHDERGYSMTVDGKQLHGVAPSMARIANDGYRLESIRRILALPEETGQRVVWVDAGLLVKLEKLDAAQRRLLGPELDRLAKDPEFKKLAAEAGLPGDKLRLPVAVDERLENTILAEGLGKGAAAAEKTSPVPADEPKTAGKEKRAPPKDADLTEFEGVPAKGGTRGSGIPVEEVLSDPGKRFKTTDELLAVKVKTQSGADVSVTLDMQTAQAMAILRDYTRRTGKVIELGGSMATRAVFRGKPYKKTSDVDLFMDNRSGNFDYSAERLKLDEVFKDNTYAYGTLDPLIKADFEKFYEKRAAFTVERLYLVPEGKVTGPKGWENDVAGRVLRLTENKVEIGNVMKAPRLAAGFDLSLDPGSRQRLREFVDKTFTGLSREQAKGLNDPHFGKDFEYELVKMFESTAPEKRGKVLETLKEMGLDGHLKRLGYDLDSFVAGQFERGLQGLPPD